MSAPNIAAAARGQYIMLGQAGDSISELQDALRRNGADLEATGTFDDATDQAVRAFQGSHDCKVDGIVGPETLISLGFDLSSDVVEEVSVRKRARKVTAPPINGTTALTPPVATGPSLRTAPPAAGTESSTVAVDPATPRATGAGGHAVMDSVAGLARGPREAQLLAEMESGNMPAFLQQVKPVTISNADGSERTIWVTPDYVGVGSDKDWVRTPLGVAAAQELARSLGGRLPTKEESDAIWEQADDTLPFSKRTPDATMMSVPVMTEHSDYLEQIRIARDIPQGALVAGHKKDVLEPAVEGKVTIYGWRGDRPAEGEAPRKGKGLPIQPYASPHEAAYADYSHGVRIVFDTPPQS